MSPWSTMLFLRPLLLTILVPALTSGILYLILRSFAAKVAAPIAIVVGYLAAYVAVVPGLPNFPPKEFKDYVFYLAVFGLVWGGLETFWKQNDVLRWGLRALAFLGILLLVLRNRFRAWETWEIIAWMVGIIVVLLAAWWVLERLTGTSAVSSPLISPIALFIALIIFITGSSVTIATSGSASFGQLGGAFAASVGAVMFLSWFLKVEVNTYLATTLIFVLAGLWLGGAVFAKLPVISAIVLALSPLTLLLVPTVNTLRGNIIRLAVLVIPIALVVAYGVWQFILDSRQPAF
jgi:hypothetical protein